MSIKTLAVAIALVTGAGAACAADFSPTFAGLSAGFDVSHTAAFTDTLTFALPGGLTSAEVSFSAFSIGLGAHNIDFISAALNGVALVVRNGYVDTIDLPSPLTLTGPLTLVIRGTSGSLGHYYGALVITSVPEPENVALALAGLGVMGRRQNGRVMAA